MAGAALEDNHRLVPDNNQAEGRWAIERGSNRAAGKRAIAQGNNRVAGKLAIAQEDKVSLGKGKRVTERANSLVGDKRAQVTELPQEVALRSRT